MSVGAVLRESSYNQPYFDRLQLLKAVVIVLISTAVNIPKVHAQSSSPFSAAQQAAIEIMIHDYILSHPALVLDALEKEQDNLDAMKQKADESSILANQSGLFNDHATPILGNPSGTVTIVEFYDYQCPFCRKMNPIINGLIKANPQLRIIMKDFPILGPTSEYAARVGLVAEEHEKYQVYYHAIESEPSPINNGEILECAGLAGLNLSKTQREVSEPWVNDELLKDQSLASSLGLDGTPDFIIGKTLIEGVTDQSQLAELVQKEEREK